MGIFSASHRQLATEAFDCVFRRVTFRKCTTGFDTKMKTRISTGLLKQNKALGGFVFKYFEGLSWVLTVLTVASLVLSVIGVYNWWAFGNCNGPNSSEFCIYNTFSGQDPSKLSPSDIKGKPDLVSGQWQGGRNASLTIVEFGCFSCPFTKQSEPAVQKILSDYDGQVNLLWKYFPLPSHQYSSEAALSVACAAEQGKFAEYKGRLFDNQLLFRDEGMPVFNSIAREVGLDQNSFAQCLGSGKYSDVVNTTSDEGKRMGIYGTPTFFIGDTVLVGPQSYDQLKSVIESELAKKS